MLQDAFVVDPGVIVGKGCGKRLSSLFDRLLRPELGGLKVRTVAPTQLGGSKVGVFGQQAEHSAQKLRLEAEASVRYHEEVEKEVEGISYASHVTKPRKQIVSFTLNYTHLRRQVYGHTDKLAAAIGVLIQVICPSAWLCCAQFLPKVEVCDAFHA